MKNYIMMMLFAALAISCTQETPTVKHVKKTSPKTDLTGITVANAEDPICHMKTADYLKDTANYKGKIYGFCSENCKKEFKKEPEKYTQNEKK